MAVEVLPVVKHTPVLAGVNGTDPFMLMPRFLAELKDMGFSGVQNFPTVGLFDGVMRTSFEETGMGFGLEVDMIAEAHRLDLLTTPYVFNPDEAKAMTEGRRRHHRRAYGRDHRRFDRRHQRQDAGQCVAEIDAIADAAKSVREDVIMLCHGGPIAMPDDADYILKQAKNCHGFYGASSMERLPVEGALAEQTRKFKAISF
jgi:predicted TIM-barrel enzyme